MRYRNPVLPGTHPDPTVCRVGDDYYLATSSFEYFPGIPLYHSEDLVFWEHIGHALTRESQLNLEGVASSEGIYAPTLRYHDGTFYLVTTFIGGGGHFVVTADDPAGEWSDPTYLDAPGFDPDLFFEDDTVYLSYATGPTLPETTIKGATVDLETGAVSESRELWQGIEGMFCEAPHLYEIDGTYYLLAAEGGTHVNHMVIVARADDPSGSFEPCPRNPILSHRGHPMRSIDATGHGDLVDTPDGSWWIVFLGIRQRGGHPGWHHLGRETFLAPVEWEAGWPVVNGGDPIEIEMTVDSDAPEPLLQAHSTCEAFDGEHIDDAFEYRRNPIPDAYSLRDEGLILRPRTETLDEPGATFLGCRQAHFDCWIEAHLAFDPDPGEEAGIALIADERHHYELGVTGRSEGPIVFVRLRIGDATTVVAKRPADGDDHLLAIEATAETYRFDVEVGTDKEETTLATAATRYLATEVTGSFTGVYVGPYATSGLDDKRATEALFEQFIYEPSD